jgi:hypothetical protein
MKTNALFSAYFLLLIFIVLKLSGIITWSWLWVLSPLWIPFALSFSIIFTIVLSFILFTIFLYLFDTYKGY